MPPLLVVACNRCRRAKVVEEGRKSTACPRCGRDLVVADLRPFYRGGDAEEARHTAGRLNATLAGRPEEFAAAFLPSEAPVARHDSPWAGAAAAARAGRSEAGRADALARSLSARLGGFGEEDLVRAFDLAGLPVAKAEAHLRRMLEAQVLFERRPGRYFAL